MRTAPCPCAFGLRVRFELWRQGGAHAWSVQQCGAGKRPGPELSAPQGEGGGVRTREKRPRSRRSAHALSALCRHVGCGENVHARPQALVWSRRPAALFPSVHCGLRASPAFSRWCAGPRPGCVS